MPPGHILSSLSVLLRASRWPCVSALFLPNRSAFAWFSRSYTTVPALSSSSCVGLGLSLPNSFANSVRLCGLIHLSCFATTRRLRVSSWSSSEAQSLSDSSFIWSIRAMVDFHSGRVLSAFFRPSLVLGLTAELPSPESSAFFFFPLLFPPLSPFGRSGWSRDFFGSLEPGRGELFFLFLPFNSPPQTKNLTPPTSSINERLAWPTHFLSKASLRPFARGISPSSWFFNSWSSTLEWPGWKVPLGRGDWKRKTGPSAVR